MYNFLNDYSEGAHPNILRALETINYHQNNSYGSVSYTHLNNMVKYTKNDNAFLNGKVRRAIGYAMEVVRITLKVVPITVVPIVTR